MRQPLLLSFFIVLITGVVFYVDFSDSVLTNWSIMTFLHVIPFGMMFSEFGIMTVIVYYVLLWLAIALMFRLIFWVVSDVRLHG